MIANKAVLALALAGAAVLVGCGRQSDLERPRPLGGHITPPSAAATERNQAEARAKADADRVSGRQAPQSVEEVRGQGVTPRENPVKGAPPDPNAPHPQGVLPDPLSRPSSVPQ